MWKKKITNPFDSYMLSKVRRLKDVRTRYAATGERAVLAGVPEAVESLPETTKNAKIHREDEKSEICC